MTTLQTKQNDVAAMDDLQFNASLDALLDSESLDASGSYQPNTMTGMQGTGSSNSSAMHGQGTMGNRSTNMAYQPTSMSAYAVGPNSQISSTGGPQLTSSYLRDMYPSMMGCSAPSVSSMGSEQHHLPIMPTPPGVGSSMDCASVATSTGGASSVVSGSCGRKSQRRSSGMSSSSSRKRARDATAVSEDEDDEAKRRHDRNLREQQRSHKITEQIDTLKEVLAAANIPFKPDKYSTLVTVAEYIQQLQAKSAMLDQEQKKLIETISRTNKIINDQYVPASTNGENPPGTGSLDGQNVNGGQSEEVYVPNVDYRNLFVKCGVPLAVLSIDGRFLDCNSSFEHLTGHGREELLPNEQPLPLDCESQPNEGMVEKGAPSRNLSLFNILTRESMEGVFHAMTQMLKHPPVKQTAGQNRDPRDFWSGLVTVGRIPDKKTRMHISLVRSPQGKAKFFDCSLTLLTDETPL